MDNEDSAGDEAFFQEPRAVALAWAKIAIGGGRLDLVWSITEPIGRLCIVQDWVHRNWEMLQPKVPDREAVMADLASENPRGELADDFFADRAAYLQRSYADVEMEHFVVGQNHRLLGPDMEVVLLIDDRDLGVNEQGKAAWLPDTRARTLPIAMRLLGNRWLVHSPGVVMEPGWPPTVIETLAAD